MSKKSKEAEARILTCAITGESFTYIGHGRPPRYSPEGKRIAAKKSRQTRYKAKREAAGKGYTPRPRLLETGAPAAQ